MISDETITLLSQVSGKPVYRDDISSLFLQLNSKKAFAPSALVSGLLESLLLRMDLTDSQKWDDSEHLFSDMLARDKYTGYYIHTALRTIYLDFALTRTMLPNQEKRNFLIMGDYFNLSSVNDAIGRGATNDLMATICGIYLDCFTRAGVVDCLYHRSMGDEVTFIAVNTDEKKVENGLKEAEKMTQEFISALGLERLRHKKYPRQCGAGLVTASIALKKDHNQRLLKQQLDDVITTRKKSSGLSSWYFLRRRGVEPQQFHTRVSEQRIDRTLYKYRIYRLSSEFANDANIATGMRTGLKHATALLIGRAIAWPRDDRIEYLRRHHDNTKMMLRADIYNLGGLNAVYGHDGADHIKAHMIRILFSTICAYDVEEPRIFDCGGGIIDIVINRMPHEQLNNVISAIQTNVYHQLLSLSIAGYANAYNLSYAGEGNITLAYLPHPRGEHVGTGLIMATHAVERIYSLPEIIERLDKISNRTKMHDLAYLWHDENHIVWALPLNTIAEPIEIGPDRLNPGLHYLPYTDALRDYLQADDLPNIFERPVGQICEILFGADMQAVLGFKKAIRLLQEKEIPDDIIVQIDSYPAMDAALLKLSLPPLSVVSTQNRPAFIRDERPAFKTMTLAEKLEDLPSSLTDLILQTQASFRTLRTIKPHGHLESDDAVTVLLEELSIPDTVEDSLIFSDRLYRLARLFDRGFSVLGRDMPEELVSILYDFSLDTLASMALAFERADESLLAKKLQIFVRDQKQVNIAVEQRLALIEKEIEPLVSKLNRKKILKLESSSALLLRFKTLFEQLNLSFNPAGHQ
jgi:GGDEF domain-containing protein